MFFIVVIDEGEMKPTISVRQSLKKLGRDIRNARLRRRIGLELLAERSMVSRSVLNKIQNGDPGVSIGAIASVLFALGMGTPLAMLADLKNDPSGQMLDEERLPKRVFERRLS